MGALSRLFNTADITKTVQIEHELKYYSLFTLSVDKFVDEFVTDASSPHET